jgi:hypothetical protein
MKRLLEKLLTFIGFGPSPCSAVPLRWRVRWFVRGMGSILVPISAEEFRREVDQCVDEMEPRTATTYTKSYVSASFGTEGSPLVFQLVTMKSGLDEIAVIPASLLREMIDELRPILDSENTKIEDA